MPKIFISIYPKKVKYAEANVIEPEYIGLSERCPLCKNAISASTVKHPVRVQITSKKTPDCLYAYGLNVPFLLSARCINVMEKAAISGLVGVEPVDQIIYRQEQIQSCYYIPKIKRINLPIDKENSNIVYGDIDTNSACPLCNPVGKTVDFVFGLHFDLTKYDGTDIFKIFEFGDTVFFSEKFVSLIKNEALSNFIYEDTRYYDSNLKNIYSSAELIEMFGTDKLI